LPAGVYVYPGGEAPWVYERNLFSKGASSLQPWVFLFRKETKLFISFFYFFKDFLFEWAPKRKPLRSKEKTPYCG